LDRPVLGHPGPLHPGDARRAEDPDHRGPTISSRRA